MFRILFVHVRHLYKHGNATAKKKVANSEPVLHTRSVCRPHVQLCKNSLCNLAYADLWSQRARLDELILILTTFNVYSLL